MDQRKIISTKNTDVDSDVIKNNNNDDIDDFEKKIIKRKINKEANQKLRNMVDNFQMTIQNDFNKKNDTMTAIQTTVSADIGFSQKEIRALVNLNKSIPIGDVSLEQTIEILSNPSRTQLFPVLLQTNRYKKDYFTLEFNDLNSKIIKYGVFALFFNGKTYVLNTTNKYDMNETIIVYSESTLDPSVIVDTIYRHENQFDRSLYLKRYARRENNPERLEDLTITQISEKPVKHMFTGDIVVGDIDIELVKLNIIIKNGNYISTTEFNKLNAVISIMLTF